MKTRKKEKKLNLLTIFKQRNYGTRKFRYQISNTEKYCRFKKSRIKYIDYKDADFLLKFVNEQGKLLPRRITGTSTKYQKKVAQAVKRARHLALMPYVADLLK